MIGPSRFGSALIHLFVRSFVHSFFHLLKYLLRTYWVPGTLKNMKGAIMCKKSDHWSIIIGLNSHLLASESSDYYFGFGCLFKINILFLIPVLNYRFVNRV